MSAGVDHARQAGHQHHELIQMPAALGLGVRPIMSRRTAVVVPTLCIGSRVGVEGCSMGDMVGGHREAAAERHRQRQDRQALEAESGWRDPPREPPQESVSHDVQDADLIGSVSPPPPVQTPRGSHAYDRRGM